LHFLVTLSRLCGQCILCLSDDIYNEFLENEMPALLFVRYCWVYSYICLLCSIPATNPSLSNAVALKVDSFFHILLFPILPSIRSQIIHFPLSMHSMKPYDGVDVKLYVMGLQPLYGMGLCMLLWAHLRAACEKIIVSGITKCLNYCVIFVVYRHFTSVVVGPHNTICSQSVVWSVTNLDTRWG